MQSGTVDTLNGCLHNCRIDLSASNMGSDNHPNRQYERTQPKIDPLMFATKSPTLCSLSSSHRDNICMLSVTVVFSPNRMSPMYQLSATNV